jgi:hypothetical protein
MGYTHFLTRTIERVSTARSLQVLAYNFKRVMNTGGGQDDEDHENGGKLGL